jgi:hypothetical protein
VLPGFTFYYYERDITSEGVKNITASAQKSLITSVAMIITDCQISDKNNLK